LFQILLICFFIIYYILKNKTPPLAGGNFILDIHPIFYVLSLLLLLGGSATSWRQEGLSNLDLLLLTVTPEAVLRGQTQ